MSQMFRRHIKVLAGAGAASLAVLAATWLTDAFNKIADQFQAANPGVTAIVTPEGSAP